MTKAEGALFNPLACSLADRRKLLLRLSYPAILGKEARGFSVLFPDLPGCCTCGDDEEHAVRMAEEALSLHVQGHLDDGLALPPPSELSDVLPPDFIEEAKRLRIAVVFGPISS